MARVLGNCVRAILSLHESEGESGAGKTAVGLHVLLEGRARGESTLWVTLS